MRIPRPAAEKLGVDRQDPDLDGLLLGLIRRATGGCHEDAARLAHPQVGGKGRGLNDSTKPYYQSNAGRADPHKHTYIEHIVLNSLIT